MAFQLGGMTLLVMGAFIGALHLIHLTGVM